MFRLRDGRILEERVYADTAPLRAAATGEHLDHLSLIMVVGWRGDPPMR
jgi:hypothetical protein